MYWPDIIKIFAFFALPHANNFLAHLAIYHYKLEICGKSWDLQLRCEQERCAYVRPVQEACMIGGALSVLFILTRVILHWHVGTDIIVGAGILGQAYFTFSRFYFIFRGKALYWPIFIGMVTATFFSFPFVRAILLLLGMCITILLFGLAYFEIGDRNEYSH